MNFASKLSALLLCVFSAPWISAQLNVDFLGRLEYSEDLSDIWGWHNPLDGKEYALIGVFDGFSIADVSDPANPVELHFVPGTPTIWRDVKTWDHYAYVTNEGGGGLLIVDLSGLPGSINTWSWTGGSLGYSTAHNIFMDEHGVAYLCGSNGGLGTLFLDVAADPIDPPVLGSYTTRYVHDLYVRGDTMWTAEINNGIFSVVDITDKSNPLVMATQGTTSDFTHNLWLSDDASWLVTTDEVSGAFIDAYDVSDLSDIRRLDTWQSNPGSGVIPHNVFILGQHLLTAYYRDGLTITDATYPDNLIQTGFYDSSDPSGDGFNGAWGTYPYLPSGHVLVSDIEEGLFVLAPDYIQAAYLRGLVVDSITGIPLSGVSISILGSPDALVSSTSISGEFATGSYQSGTYTIRATRFGYESKEITGVMLNSGLEENLFIELFPIPSFTQNGWVLDSITQLGIANAQVAFETEDTIFYVMADATGRFSFPSLLAGTYDIYAGQWSYQTKRFSDRELNALSPELLLEINRGYYDDFLFANNWTVTGTASVGHWERGIPIGTFLGSVPVNPGADVSSDFGEYAYVTGNGGGTAGLDDVDNGTTILHSPVFDLSDYGDPHISYYRWFYNGGGASPPNDSLIVRISNGTETVNVETVVDGDPWESQWRLRSFRVADFMEPGPNMQFIVYTADDVGFGHLVEGGLDAWAVDDEASSSAPVAQINPALVSTCAGQLLQFDDESSNFPLSRRWDFPGGIPDQAYEPNPVVSYPMAGNYDVQLTVYNASGSDAQLLSGAVQVADSLIIELNTTASTNGWDGQASVENVSGGTPPYTYLWNDPVGQSGKTASELAPGDYEVTVTSSEGCQVSAVVTVGGFVSSIEDTEANPKGIQAFPNPFSHSVQLNIEQRGILSWQISDVQGRLLLSGDHNGQIGSLQLSLPSAWEPGVYTLVLYGERGIAGSIPLIKQQP